MPGTTGPETYDLIVVGGGIHGVMTALVAAESGLRPLVLDRGSPGGATSASWFGILHGGLRYLQSLDIPRLRQSVIARRWFLQTFPELVRPLPFLMPLYGQGLKRPEIFRLAFLADALFAADRNRGVPVSCRMEKGFVLGPAGVAGHFPGVRREGLQGGALWHEAVVPDSAALFAALVARAGAAGASIRGGVEVMALHQTGGRVTGVETVDLASGRAGTCSAPVVINAAGPWSGVLARRFDPDAPELFHPALGFNLLLDRPPPAAVGVSVTPPDMAGPMLFVYPQGCRTFVGTWYAPWQGSLENQGLLDNTLPDSAMIQAFLDALDAAVPELGATMDDILEVTAGLLPAAAPGTTDLVSRDGWYDHGRSGGPAGLFTTIGVKYTTAREVAWRTLHRAGLLRRTKSG